MRLLTYESRPGGREGGGLSLGDAPTHGHVRGGGPAILPRWAPTGPARGRVLLIHGLSSIAGTWWWIGPALAARGWDVSAVDQAGHGAGRRGEVEAAGLAAAVLEVHPEAPHVLIGHSLGTVAAIGLLERDPGWAGTVILEEPPSPLAPELCLGMAESITADAAAVREDRAGLVERIRREQPRWADEDVRWAVEGIAGWIRSVRALAPRAGGGGRAGRRARALHPRGPAHAVRDRCEQRACRCSTAVWRSAADRALISRTGSRRPRGGAGRRALPAPRRAGRSGWRRSWRC